MAKRRKKARGAVRRPEAQAGAWRRAAGRSVAVAALMVLVAGLWAGWAWLRDPAHLPLRQLQIVGEFRHLDENELRQAVAPLAVGGFFSVDVDAVREAAEALPWVRRVRVRRVWPDTLRLQVVEQEAVARWGERGLLNRHGELFQPPAEDIDPRLPLLQGPEALRERVMRRYARVVARLRPLGLEVARLELNERRAWRLVLDDGLELRLGREETERRLGRFIKAWPKVFADAGRAAEHVDLRYSNGFAVRWKAAEQEG